MLEIYNYSKKKESLKEDNEKPVNTTPKGETIKIETTPTTVDQPVKKSCCG